MEAQREIEPMDLGSKRGIRLVLRAQGTDGCGVVLVPLE